MIWAHNRYRRSFRSFGHTITMLHMMPWLEDLVVDALAYSGGIPRRYLSYWATLVREMDVDDPAVPVDEDRDGSLLAAAVEEHRHNLDVGQMFRSWPWRDSIQPRLGIRPHLEWSVLSHLPAIRRSGVAVYHLAGWHDRYVRGQLLIHHNLTWKNGWASISTRKQRLSTFFLAENPALPMKSAIYGSVVKLAPML